MWEYKWDTDDNSEIYGPFSSQQMQVFCPWVWWYEMFNQRNQRNSYLVKYFWGSMTKKWILYNIGSFKTLISELQHWVISYLVFWIDLCVDVRELQNIDSAAGSLTVV